MRNSEEAVGSPFNKYITRENRSIETVNQNLRPRAIVSSTNRHSRQHDYSVPQVLCDVRLNLIRGDLLPSYSSAACIAVVRVLKCTYVDIIFDHRMYETMHCRVIEYIIQCVMRTKRVEVQVLG